MCKITKKHPTLFQLTFFYDNSLSRIMKNTLYYVIFLVFLNCYLNKLWKF